MPKISVIVPVYNAEKYLKRCVDSILSQSYQDFELILVDDGSKDQSGILCDQIAMLDGEKRIRVIHQKNAGQSAARNRAVEIAKGKWVTFIDSDDYVHPQLLEMLYQGIIQHNVKISMCDAVFEAQNSENVELFHDKVEWKIDVVNEAFFHHLYNIEWRKGTYKNEVIWGKLMDIMIPKQLPLQEGRIYEDSAIMCRWFDRAGRVAEVAYPMYYYVDNPAGTMNAPFTERKLDKLWALEEMEKMFREKRYKRMTEQIQKIYCNVAIQYEDDCPDKTLKRKIQKMRRKKVVKSIRFWRGSLKQKYIDFSEYYIAKKGS